VLGGALLYCVGFCLLSTWRIDRDYYPCYYATPYSRPPDPRDNLDALKRRGLISSIETRLRKGGVIKIRHVGGFSDFVSSLYLYFQGPLLTRRIDIGRIVDFNPSSLEDVDYIIAHLDEKNTDFIPSESGRLLPKKILLKSYKVLFDIDGIIFLEIK
jgi:hypothetical protein